MDKRQVSVLAALTFVLVCLAAGIFFLPPVSGFASAPPPKAHEKQRSARFAAGAISWETNLGGSGDETLTAAYRYLGKIYIFGNTTSADFDFDKSPVIGDVGDELTNDSGITGFAARLDENGRTEAFALFKAPLAAVSLWEKGFVAGVNFKEGGCAVYFDGEFTALGIAKTYSTEPEYIEDIKLFGSFHHIVTTGENTNTHVRYLRVWKFGEDMTPAGDVIAKYTWSTDFVMLLPAPDGYALLAQAKDLTTEYLVSVFYGDNTGARVTSHPYSAAYKVLDAIIFEGGYAVAVSGGGRTELMTLDFSLSYKTRINLDLGESENAKLALTNGGIALHANLKTGESAALLLDSALNVRGPYATLEGLTALYEFYPLNGATTVFAGKTAKGLTVRAQSGTGEYKADFGCPSEENAQILPTAKGVVTVSESGARSGDVKDNFGKKDIWICFANFNL